MSSWAIRDKRSYDQISSNDKEKSRITTMTILQILIQQLDTKYDLANTLAYVNAGWFEIGHIPLYKYPEKSTKRFGVKERSDGHISSMEESRGTS